MLKLGGLLPQAIRSPFNNWVDQSNVSKVSETTTMPWLGIKPGTLQLPDQFPYHLATNTHTTLYYTHTHTHTHTTLHYTHTTTLHYTHTHTTLHYTTLHTHTHTHIHTLHNYTTLHTHAHTLYLSCLITHISTNKLLSLKRESNMAE